jgi:hypothetical protein
MGEGVFEGVLVALCCNAVERPVSGVLVVDVFMMVATLCLPDRVRI